MPDGKPVEIYTLKSPAVELQVMTFGPRIVSLDTKDRNGKMGDIALGYADFNQYLKDNKTYFGSVPGRYANRIANKENSHSRASRTRSRSTTARTLCTAAKLVSPT